MVDLQTLQYYQQNAPDIFDRYNACVNGIDRYFPVSFPPGQKILDIGSGSGRDLLKLLELGHDAYGMEPCEELRDLALRKHPQLCARLTGGSLPSIGTPFDGDFDGILCSAVLMHISHEHLFDSVYAIRNILKRNGRLLISIPTSRPGLDGEHRDDKGRLFAPHNPDCLRLLFERIGFRTIGRWEDKDGLDRKDIAWATMLFQLEQSSNIRPIDQIEGILNRDRKVATYKLALIRALCDIAMTNFHIAGWLEGGTISIPLEPIAERWLFYYWPLFESENFIPQIQGESETCKKPVAFRKHMKGLIDAYHSSGGLSRFTMDHRSSGLTDRHRSIFTQALQSISRTIVSGPVAYAGGSLESGAVFKYDSKTRSVRFSSDIWHELTLMGHWINDAILLRWATLTSRLSRGNPIQPSEVMNFLLVDPIPERDVQGVRQTYNALQAKECVWTAQPLGSSFEIDHVIPFSLWKNNSLWNLLPVTKVVNREKRDLLPRRDLMLRRKDRMIAYWQILRNRQKNRFDYEVRSFVGQKRFDEENWENQVFNNLVESVEYTAVQRGCERWAP